MLVGMFINGFNTLGFAIPLISELFMFFDYLIYSCASMAFKTFFAIADISTTLAVNAPQVEFIMNRVMVLSGIYALFRLSIMLVNYLIHPEKVSDLSKGSSNIITSVIIAVILLSMSGFIFRQLGDLQSRIFNNQVIPKLIYGGSGASEVGTVEAQADQFVNNVWLLFYQPKEPGSCEGNSTGACRLYNEVKNGNSQKSIFSLVGTNYTEFDYTPIISGIVGILLIYYFVKFSIALGVRIFKLFTLQVISPIPIIMSIEPKKKSQLTKFATTYLLLYSQVFIRVLTFYLAFVVLDILNAMPGDLSNSYSSAMILETNFIINIILIFAVFQAANELPKLIEDVLGVKLGIDTSNKGFGGVLKGIIGGGVGLAGGAVAGGIAGFGTGTVAGGAIAGALSGMLGGATAMSTNANVGKGIASTISSIGKSHQLGGKIANSGGLLPYMSSGIENFFGANKKDASELSRFDRLSGDQDKLIDSYNSSMSDLSTIDQLMGGIETSLDQAFAASSPNRKDISTFVNSDGEYSKMQLDYQRDFGIGGSLENDSTARQEALNKINEKRASLESDYRNQRKNFAGLEFAKYKRNLEGANTPGFVADKVDANFKKALEDYNSYVTNHGMTDRVVSVYSREQGAGSLDDAKDFYGREKVKIQSQIEDAKAEKQRIADEKKAFSNDPKVKARANRDKPRDAEPWTRDN